MIILQTGLISFQLHLKSYLVYEKGHKVGRLLLVHLLVSVAESKLQGDVKLAYSVFAGIPSAVACKKGNWTKGRIG